MTQAKNIIGKRELKFRAWLIDSNPILVLPVDVLVNDHEGNIEEVRTYDNENFYTWLGNDCAVMQYTGLKDKNDKEIFEGDILKARNRTKEVVEWVEVCCGFVPFIEDMSDCGNWIDRDTMEIIGNVFESPELLTSSEDD